MTTSKAALPFGTWKSPITSAMVAQALRLEDVAWDSDGETLVWQEGRSGRGVLVMRGAAGEAARELTADQNVRGGVGYGGGGFSAAKGSVFFAEKNGRLYRLPLGYGSPTPLTPQFGAAASPVLSPDGRWLAYIFSDGHADALALVDSAGQDWPQKLAHIVPMSSREGADFYMQPAWHPLGDRLAWVEWDHPNMPWDGTRLVLGKLEGSPPRLVEQTVIAGDARTPAQQPAFSPDGRWLSYICGEGEWENLDLFDLQSGERHVLVRGEGFNLAQPAWAQGERSYGWNHNSERIFYIRYAGAFASLWVVELASGESRQIDTAPYTWLGQLAVSPTRDALALIASSPQQPGRVVRWENGRLFVAARSDTESIAPDYLPQPREITWKAPDGSPVHGLYFAPSNPDFTAEGLPPAILSIHGGPTSLSPASYDAECAYFTSRGYAWLEVNYRGSTGYGRAYQDALLGRWGEIDVEDARDAARALVEQRLADPGRLVIMGGSAGGYTVLNALIRHPGLFKAGVCRYGVSNLFSLSMDTHKFELHYTDMLVGALPAAAQRYHDWSPIFHVDSIRDPLAVFQGAEDVVVPPDQSELVVAALRRNGVPHIYQLYPGEGHGFRKKETLADYYEQVERFLRQYVLFSA